jgi:hypothetical protein
VRYYGTYSNKTRGQTPLIPDRIIRPPESSPNLKSPISNIQSTILLIPAPPKQSARDMRPGEDARLQDSKTQEPRQESAISSAKFRGTRMNRL